MEFLGGDQWKSLTQIEALLRTENRDRAGAGAVGFGPTLFENELEESVVLLHGGPPRFG